MIRTTLRKLSASDITRYARNGEEFTAAAMSGVVGATDTGRMPEANALAYRSTNVLYTVRSYGTPIAWLTPAGWIVSDVKYSATTSTRHQPIVRQLFPRA
jgi:hypothetical protein